MDEKEDYDIQKHSINNEFKHNKQIIDNFIKKWRLQSPKTINIGETFSEIKLKRKNVYKIYKNPKKTTDNSESENSRIEQSLYLDKENQIYSGYSFEQQDESKRQKEIIESIINIIKENLNEKEVSDDDNDYTENNQLNDNIEKSNEEVNITRDY